MRQKKICDIWGASCPPRKTFFDLSESIRRCIYLYAGVCLHHHIVLKAKEVINRQHSCLALLQTCKAIHDEVKAIAFSENQIIAPHDDINNALNLLWRLPPQICSKLTRLCVHLDVGASARQHQDVQRQRPLPDSSDRMPTSHPIWPGPLLDLGKFSLWQAVAKRLLSHSPPGTLNLHLVCHSTDMKLISFVLQPFADYPGVLKDFDLDLGHRKDIDTVSQALMTDSRLPVMFKGPRDSAKPFRYFNLPAEIQEQVLVNTDLVTPFREVYWNADCGYHINYDYWDYEVRYCKPYPHAGCPFRFCSPSKCWVDNHVFHCTHRTGYASCLRCWQSPRSLMAVSRAMYADANRVLWKYNRIIIYPWMFIQEFWDIFPPVNVTTVNATKFMTRNQWPHILRHLRTIELVFQNVKSVDWESSPGAVVDGWRSAVSHLREYANVEKLTIIVYMTRSLTLRPTWDTVHDPRIFDEWPESDTQLATMVEEHSRYLQPLQSLHHMKRFFVHLERHTVARDLMRHVKDEEKQKSFLLYLRKAEIELEKRVMGKHYDSGSLGKDELQPSQWLKTACTDSDE
ncbi:hypothetical protein HD806DRAFT_232787 [Xylariaceae sp. AK1471]|nr:hypothetical protein HD806DRAFT_232787 [Xylariaceae sp. AK1471]